jgi:hypothetical protein
MINTIAILILIIIGIIIAPFMTIGVILMMSTLGILVKTLGIIVFMIGFFRMFVKLLK